MDHPLPVSYKTLDEIVEDVRYQFDRDAGNVFTVQWAFDELRRRMNASGTVFYQP